MKKVITAVVMAVTLSPSIAEINFDDSEYQSYIIKSLSDMGFEDEGEQNSQLLAYYNDGATQARLDNDNDD